MTFERCSDTTPDSSLRYKGPRISFEHPADLDHNLYLEPLNHVDRILSVIQIQEQLKAFQQRCTGDILGRLRYTAEILRHSDSPVALSADQLQALQDRTSNLILQVLEAADLDPHLKREMIRGLEIALEAIRAYRVSGADGLREAADLNLGMLARYRDRLRQAETGELRKWAELVRDIYAGISLGLDLLGPVAEWLPQITP